MGGSLCGRFQSGKARLCGTNFPSTRAVDSIDIALSDPKVAAVVIATPAATDFGLAKKVLEAGKHVLVEKPLATTTSEVDELAQSAVEKRLIVMAGHTFVYNAAVRHVKELIDGRELGDIRYIYSQRLNLGRIRADIDALWNFGPQDLSIIQYWLGGSNPSPSPGKAWILYRTGSTTWFFSTWNIHPK